MKMDWGKESQGGDFTVYPKGSYKISVTGYEQVTASTGTPQLRWRTSILEPVEYINKPFTFHTALTEKSLWRVARLVKACGIDTTALGSCEVGSKAFLDVCDACVRRTAYFTLDIVPDNKGRDRNDVVDFKEDPDQEPASVNGADEDVPDFLKEVKE